MPPRQGTKVMHIQGKSNPSEFFTEEMRDDAHFHRLRDSMMVSKSALLEYYHTALTHVSTSEHIFPYYYLVSPQEVSHTVSRAKPLRNICLLL